MFTEASLALDCLWIFDLTELRAFLSDPIVRGVSGNRRFERYKSRATLASPLQNLSTFPQHLVLALHLLPSLWPSFTTHSQPLHHSCLSSAVGSSKICRLFKLVIVVAGRSVSTCQRRTQRAHLCLVLSPTDLVSLNLLQVLCSRLGSHISPSPLEHALPSFYLSLLRPTRLASHAILILRLLGLRSFIALEPATPQFLVLYS